MPDGTKWISFLKEIELHEYEVRKGIAGLSMRLGGQIPSELLMFFVHLKMQWNSTIGLRMPY